MKAEVSFPRMHVSLYVKDIAETTKFYTNFFNQAPEKERPGYVKYLLNEPALIISFIQSPERVKSNFGHLGFQVASVGTMIDQLERAKQLGIVEKEEMGTNCCYAKQDKFWVNDPDGHKWEVYYFHADAEFNDPHYEIKEAKACC